MAKYTVCCESAQCTDHRSGCPFSVKYFYDNPIININKMAHKPLQ